MERKMYANGCRGKTPSWVVILRAALIASLWFAFIVQADAAAPATLKSPGGELGLKAFGAARSCPAYEVKFKDASIITESRLGLDIKHAPLYAQLEVTRQTVPQRDST